MHLEPIGWALYAENLIVDNFSQNSMAAPIKIVKKRTTRFKCVYESPRPFYSLISFQASPIRPLQECQRELEKTQGH